MSRRMTRVLLPMMLAMGGLTRAAYGHPFHRGHEHLSLGVVGLALVLVLAVTVLALRGTQRR